MSTDTSVATRGQVRIFVTGSCEGLDELRDALEQHTEIELVGSNEGVADSAGVLAGGHLEVVLHATRSPRLPLDELAAIGSTRRRRSLSSPPTPRPSSSVKRSRPTSPTCCRSRS